MDAKTFFAVFLIILMGKVNSDIPPELVGPSGV
jgi:hypothetical protein